MQQFFHVIMPFVHGVYIIGLLAALVVGIPHMRPVLLVAGNTVVGVLRGAVLNVLVVLAAVMLLASLFPSMSDNPSDMRKMMVDSGIALISVLGALIAVLTGFSLLPNEVDSRTAYPVLSKPVGRWQFVLGKYLGAVGINAVSVGLLSLLFFAVYLYRNNWHFDSRLPMAVFMVFATLCVLSAMIIALSTFMSWIGTIIVSMCIWLVGSFSQFLSAMADRAGTDIVYVIQKYAILGVQKVLPNFQAMDLRTYLNGSDALTWQVFVADKQVLMGQIIGPLYSSSMYVVVALIVAVIIFNYRELS